MKSLGRRGEDLTASYLHGSGYEILARNWRCAQGEIDIVAYEGETLVFIEVKARRSERYGTPAEAVDRLKQERLRTLALSYISATGRTAPAYRFDVAAVDLQNNEIQLIKNAF
ncbi:MAG: YraN family protein [Dethiobacter sp.]|nr:YraN family protein [Dethiobacter sp.]MCL5982127.1 YraN family protein [Bacillota bacterium]